MESRKRRVFWAKGTVGIFCQERINSFSHKEIKAGQDLGSYPAKHDYEVQTQMPPPSILTYGRYYLLINGSVLFH